MFRFVLTGLIVFGGTGGSVVLAQSSVPTAIPFPSSTPVARQRNKHAAMALPTPAAPASAGASPLPANSTASPSAQPSPTP